MKREGDSNRNARGSCVVCVVGEYQSLRDDLPCRAGRLNPGQARAHKRLLTESAHRFLTRMGLVCFYFCNSIKVHEQTSLCIAIRMIDYLPVE